MEWGTAFEAVPGETISGDGHLVQVRGERVLIAVIDGAGHGEEAASVSQSAVSLLKRCARDPLDAIMNRCDDGLRGTRGAAVSLAVFDVNAAKLFWTGVGNVEGAFLCKRKDMPFVRESLLLRNGVVGYPFTAPRIASLPVHAGDMLIFITDGIKPNFLEGINFDADIQVVADAILARHIKGTDDALVLAMRFLKGAV